MKRIGCFTGKIYDETVDLSTVKECCVINNNPNQIDIIKARLKCEKCNGGCPNKL